MKDERIEISGKELADFLRKADAVEPIAEELRQHLNEVIAHHNASPAKILLALAYLSAAYIRNTQEHFAYSPAQCDELEDEFHNSIQLLLATFGHNDLRAEVEKMKREELN